MSLKLNQHHKTTVISFLLTLLFLCAGFSQLHLFGIRPSDVITVILFLTLLVKGKLRVPFLCYAFFLNFFYAWIIGGGDNFKSLVTNIIIFLILFSLIDYLKKVSLNRIELYLMYFNYSMFASNLIALTILVLLPQYRELVADESYGGIRLKGFFTQANGYAFVLLIAFPIAVYFLNKRKGIFNIFNVVLFLIAILLTQSRGVLFSLIIGFGVIYLIYLIKNNKVKKYLVPIIITTALLFILYTFLPEYLQDTFGISLARLNSEGISSSERNLVSLDELEGDRLYLIENAMKTIMEYPFGLGYQPHHTKIGEITGVFLLPHNYFLSLILYYGIILGLFWLGVIFVLLKKGLLKIIRLESNPKDLSFYLTIVMTALSFFYLTHSGDWSFLYIIIAFYVTLLSKKK